MGRLFGTDGARGVANAELTCETAMAIGRAAAMVLLETEGQGEYRREPQKYLLQVRDRNLTPEKITVQGLPLPPAWQRTEAGMQAEFFLEEEGDYSL